MSSTRLRLMQGSLRTLHTLGLHRLLQPLAAGLGMIVTLHRVRPAAERSAELGAHEAFDPNGLLEITPEFLDVCIEALRAEGLSVVGLDELVEALARPVPPAGRLVAFTFDDGYIDNAVHALPVLEAQQAPAVIYVPSDYPQGRGELWWVALERMVRAAEALAAPHRPGEGAKPLDTAERKLAFYLDLYWHLRAVPEDEQRALVRSMAAEQGFDMAALCRELVVDTDGLRALAAHPLVTIGAHTASHRAVARLPEHEALAEMVAGADWLEATLGSRPRHFAFPYGSPDAAGPRDYGLARQAGFASAVTTRKGMLFAQHRDHLHGLPRVSLNGHYQDRRYLELFASGAPFLLANRFRKVA